MTCEILGEDACFEKQPVSLPLLECTVLHQPAFQVPLLTSSQRVLLGHLDMWTSSPHRLRVIILSSSPHAGHTRRSQRAKAQSLQFHIVAAKRQAHIALH